MERIKQAIEKAKNQQSPSSGTPHPAIRPKTSGQKASSHPFEEIEYKVTRQATLDPRHLEKHRIVTINKNEQASWSFDLLRTQVLQKMEENGWKTLAIVSPTPEAGKTVVSINLAISIAQQTNKTSLLIDFDLRRPKVAQYLGLHPEKSLNDYFNGNATLAETLVNPGIPRFVVIPTSHHHPKSAETLSSPYAQTLLNELKERYESRIIIIDLPPLLSADDAIAILPKIDCVLLVVGSGMSKPSEIEESIHLINSTNLLGVVMNKYEDGSMKADYYY